MKKTEYSFSGMIGILVAGSGGKRQIIIEQ